MAKITGVGGVFFKSTGDSTALAAWYRKHLGMPLEYVASLDREFGPTAYVFRCRGWGVSAATATTTRISIG